MKNLKFMRIFLSVFAGIRDSFEKVVLVDLSEDSKPLEDASADEANALTESIKALLWEAVCCTAPRVEPVFIEVTAENLNFDGLYKLVILPEWSYFTGWTPKLSDIVAKSGIQIRKDLTGLLADMATAHIGTTGGGGGPYVITPRD